MGSHTPDRFDFIVVGAGPSGCTIAKRLAATSKRPDVLLIEAGGRTDNQDWKINAERWLHRFNPAMAWGYETAPMKHVDGLKISYDRGKGLGGSTNTNFSAWNIGPKGDHDTIAAMIGDDDWKWETGAHPRYIRLEDYYGQAPHVPDDFKKYLNPKPEDHGRGGPVKVGFAKIWEKSVREMLDSFLEAGYPPNPDLCDGNAIGVSVCPGSAAHGVRSTAADQLKTAPENLHVMTDVQIARVYFDGRRAKGVESLDGRRFEATKEVILSAGALNTPALLMHSGIGPADQLSRFDIPVLLENPHVGQHLRDHYHIDPTWRMDELFQERLQYYQSQDLQAAARTQWQNNRTGPLTELSCAVGLVFQKSDAVLNSEEFHDLPAKVKEHLTHPTVPSYEVALNAACPDYFVDPANAEPVACLYIFLMNPQSRGQCTLQSADPAVPLRFDPNFFSHPYDRRVAVEATRDVLRVVAGPRFSRYNRGMRAGPASDGEADILAFWKKRLGSTWHMSGTVKMGKGPDEEGACVGSDFRVFGVEGLRVVDMSVLPIMVNNHTQTTAYLVGLMAGDKMCREYGLDE